jgi:endogenous inhibitor of DNA gyrase (YacG/DUF329 family)
MSGVTERAEAPRCPICGKPAVPEFRPFCTRRCANVDLNRWLGGVYAVPVKDDEDEDARARARRSRSAGVSPSDSLAQEGAPRRALGASPECVAAMHAVRSPHS